MEKELRNFIRENGLKPFSREKSVVRSKADVFKTKDARAVFSKVVSDVSRGFVFRNTEVLLNCFSPTCEADVVRQRQEFFRNLNSCDGGFLKELGLDRASWKPPYGLVVVTQDDKTFSELKHLGIPVKILLTEADVRELEEEDVVQVINCDEFSRVLETLPQSVFLNSADDAYLERYVELLSQWERTIKVLSEKNLEGDFGKLVSELAGLLPLLEKGDSKKITRENVEAALEEVKSEISSKVKEMSVSGDSLIEVISRGAIPDELKVVVGDAIKRTGLPSEIFMKTIPVAIDEQELEKVLRKQDVEKFSSLAENVKSHAVELVGLPEKLAKLEEEILLLDFKSGVGKWIAGKEFPEIGEEFAFSEATNLFLNEPKPISFHLNDLERCSVLTGANSGGKTTLIEHAIQIVSCAVMGLPLNGKVKCPLFSEIYYFAKNKGSMSKGAFETLLTQMSKIKTGKKTLILADEIEAVTEPGVAGKMICATADYFAQKGCYMIIATHLGHEIQKNLPNYCRVDGIEASGLDENNELVVNHSPLLGKIAHSTPELIVEKMTRVNGGEYFEYVNNWLKGQ